MRLSSRSLPAAAVAAQLARRALCTLAHQKHSSFTLWHASELHELLKRKCSEPTEANRALITTAERFELQHAELQRCTFDQIVAEQYRKDFLTPAGRLRFDWAAVHSMMPMELPLRWRCRLLLQDEADSGAWSDDGSSSLLVAGEMLPAGGPRPSPPTTECADPGGLARLMEAMQAGAPTVSDAQPAPLPRERLVWLLSFLCAEPSDYAFDAMSGVLDAYVE